MQALVAPVDIIKKLNTLFFRFIWKKKYSNTKAFERVKRRIMCQKKKKKLWKKEVLARLTASQLTDELLVCNSIQ